MQTHGAAYAPDARDYRSPDLRFKGLLHHFRAPDTDASERFSAPNLATAAGSYGPDVHPLPATLGTSLPAGGRRGPTPSPRTP